MAVYMLTTDAAQSREAFEAFGRTFATGATDVTGCRLGWQGGYADVTAHWRADSNLWGVFLKNPPGQGKSIPKRPRFWNCFGLGKPQPNVMLNITAEINPPHEGEYRRTAGVFLTDTLGNRFVGHSGRIGGGRPNIGLKAFRTYANNLDWRYINTLSGEREVLVLGPLGSAELVTQLSVFVRTVAAFKQAVS